MLAAAFLLYACAPPSSSSSSGGGQAATKGGPTKPKPKAWHVSTFAGGSGNSRNPDGIGTDATFTTPFFITQSGDTLYIIDVGANSLRTIDKNTAQVRTLGTHRTIGGHANGAGTAAQFNSPRGIAAVPIAAGAAGAARASTLYVGDSSNNRIRRVSVGANAATTQVSDFVGSGTAGHKDGPGTAAQFSNPMGIAVNDMGTTLYVADSNNHRIRAVDIARKTVRTIAGDGTSGTRNGQDTDTRAC